MVHRPNTCGKIQQAECTQGEGGEQGDAMMPLLFSLGQHSVLLKVQEQLHEGEFLLAFKDDIYTVTMPERVREVHRVLEESLWSESGIRVHQGKTKIWNAAGEKPPRCELEKTATVGDPTAVVWWHQDIGNSLGHQDFVTTQLEMSMFTAEHHCGRQGLPNLSAKGAMLGCECLCTILQISLDQHI